MRAILAIRDRMGLSWSELSERTGVSRSTLASWGRKLRFEKRSRPSFAEVQLQRESEPSVFTLLLLLGDVEIELMPGKGREVLAWALELLRHC
ncbi:MAG: hypothetical protein CSA62_07130 [Planctomycetota bacterium]|nr:MAG: hypothetical protein CSA62_07130 [Planctomycetota bacterium]